MASLLSLVRVLDRFQGALGQLTGWLTLLMVLIGAYNAIVRYLGRYFSWSLSSNAYIELQWYLFGMIFLLAGGATLRRDRHVRVDVFYGRLGPRAKAWIDLVGLTVMLLPFCAFAFWTSLPMVENSWAVRETSPDPGGLARYPIKTLVPVAFALLVLQGLAEWIRRAALLAGVDPDADAPGSSGAAGEKTSGGPHGVA
ncbi:MAG: TRAP transporter small permease subunit [Acidobacteriota bacterium]